MAKATKAARLRRVDIVYRLLLLGLDTHQILEHIGRKYPQWGVRERAISDYIHDAKQLLIKAGDYERAAEFGRAVARLHDLYARCLQDKRYRDALSVQQEINKLFDFYAPVRVDIVQMRQQLVDLLLEEVMGEADEITRGAAQPH